MDYRWHLYRADLMVISSPTPAIFGEAILKAPISPYVYITFFSIASIVIANLSDILSFHDPLISNIIISIISA